MQRKLLSESALVIRIQEGDEVAFRELFFRYKNKLFNFCLFLTKSREQAEEIVHDVLVKVWTERKQLDPTKSVNNYLYIITKHFAINFLKKAAADKVLLTKVYENLTWNRYTEEELNDYDQLDKVVKEAIDLLPPKRKLIFDLSRNEGLTHEEIATYLHISKHTVRNHMVEALKFIKGYLNHHSDITIGMFALLFFVC